MKKIAPVLIGLGAISYGIPGSLFELAARAGVASGVLLVAAFFIAWFVFSGVMWTVPVHQRHASTRRQAWQVIVSGTSMAVTNTCYILSLHYVSVAIAAVMMMQSVWLSILLAALADRVWPTVGQLISVLIVLTGTVLAAGILPLADHVSVIGMGLAFMAAFAYAITIQFTGGSAANLHPLTKARLMSLGAFVLIALIWVPTMSWQQDWSQVLKWGGLVAFFAMLLPLTSFSYWMPALPMGVGPILSSLELPSSVAFAWWLLDQAVTGLQLVGVALIIGAVVTTNVFQMRHHRRHDLLKSEEQR